MTNARRERKRVRTKSQAQRKREAAWAAGRRRDWENHLLRTGLESAAECLKTTRAQLEECERVLAGVVRQSRGGRP